jgi:hypothetical protein
MRRRNLFILAAFAGFLTGAACMAAGFLLYQMNPRDEPGIVELNAAEIATETVMLTRQGVTGYFEAEGAEDAPEQSPYVLGIFDGYVTVFSTENQGRQEVMQKTATPVSALPDEEQRRLADGVKIADEEQLARILQDYGS